MERIAIIFIASAALLLTSPLSRAEDANTQAAPEGDPMHLLLAQIRAWGGGSGPRQRDCQRLCENEQVNCQRGCFGLAETDTQESCSRQCLTTYLGCAEGCRPGSTGGLGRKLESEEDPSDDSASG